METKIRILNHAVKMTLGTEMVEILFCIKIKQNTNIKINLFFLKT